MGENLRGKLSGLEKRLRKSKPEKVFHIKVNLIHKVWTKWSAKGFRLANFYLIIRYSFCTWGFSCNSKENNYLVLTENDLVRLQLGCKLLKCLSQIILGFLNLWQTQTLQDKTTSPNGQRDDAQRESAPTHTPTPVSIPLGTRILFKWTELRFE